MSKPRVLVTFDAMRYPNTGLFSFGKSFGRALLRNNNCQFELDYFFYSPDTIEFDTEDVHKTYLQKHNKFFFFNKNNVALFHFTDQMSRLKPKKVFGRKKILTIHDINQVHEVTNPDQLRIYLDKLGERIDSCDRIVTISQFAAADVLNYFPKVADKLSVIYNGADKPHLPNGHLPSYIPEREFLFTIGIVSAKKNFHVLPALLADNDLELLIAGIKTPYENQVMAEAAKYGCTDRVKVIGTISDDDRAWYYQNCQAFVFPSIAEGFGLPVIEAMHFGKPVFSSTRTSLPEVAGNAAYYFKTFDGADMQRVFKEGMQHFNANNGAERSVAHAAKYNWDDTARLYMQLYRDVLQK
ncbi:glycosyltransferase family 4 protein [Mucilaginibacter glaciei]|uniref:Glycosyltransferase family 4 protein n=1 Tax=Mucilaginibacter glaciei TaxID=2772109 RepID=A0A926NKG4_9SPHI|nr:glycosyltransferase family 1 protein [Mucilaginibacter glaciei]MBD1392886.1 glycosyltransferase family 4 protein [Mucilaginibacter glaciei]